MNCHDFRGLASDLSSADLSTLADERSLDHVRDCADCSGWLQQRQMLAAGLLALRSRTAKLEASAGVEREVLRAFRQRVVPKTAPTRAHSRVLRFPSLARWQRPAFAVAAALAVGLGLGLWRWQRPADSAGQIANQPVVQQATPDVQQPASPQQAEAAKATPMPSERKAVAELHASAAVSSRKVAAAQPARQSLTQLAQTQDYVPLMLCDPLSCSGDEQVVRMEIPANSIDVFGGSAERLLADVVIGDDGLARAIRIVQQ